MEKGKILERIEAEKLIAVVRMSGDREAVRRTVESLCDGGVSIIEITTSVPDAVGIVGSLAGLTGREFLLGAGTVLSARSAREMIEAGAEFVVSPALIDEVVEAANDARVAVFPGAFTPTEIVRAHALGADAVKVFPASFFGPSYVKALAGPMPHIPLIPTGGVDLDNIAEYVRAGSFAVGVGGKLVDTRAFERGDWERVKATAARYVEAVKNAGG